MSRTYASVLIVVLLGALLLPIRENWRDEPVDSFPLSYYPMFSHQHAEVQEFTYVLGIEPDGTVHHIHYRYCGTGGLNQVRKQVRRVAAGGPRASAALVRRVAERLERHEPELYGRLASVRLVTGLYDPNDYFAKGQKEPIRAVVHASHTIDRPGLPAPQFLGWLRRQTEMLEWPEHPTVPAEYSPNREVLERSLELGRRFLIRNQRPEGNFNYLYDFTTRRFDPSDNSVRQAGTLWSLVLIHAHLAAREGDDPKRRAAREETLAAVYRGVDFFLQHTIPGSAPGSLLIAYPEETEARTGTVALTALALIDLLRIPELPDSRAPANRVDRAKLEETLDGYLLFLVGMHLPNRHFSAGIRFSDGQRKEDFSPYYDGETLLALVKAAKYLDKPRLLPVIQSAALPLAKYYSVDQWAEFPDSDETKGFFQWSCMAFWEYADAGWKHAESFEDYVLSMAWWMIHVHKTLRRPKNTGYAYEGIIQAHRVAQRRGDAAALHDLRWTIDRGLFKLTAWQVGGPLLERNLFLEANATRDPLALGGVMNSEADPALRIDVTQHQMHALILALENVYMGEDEG